MNAVRIAVLLAAVSANAQDPTLVDVLKWKGTLSGTGRMTEKDLPVMVPGVTITIDYTASFTANVEVERVQADPPRWTGKIVGSTMTAHYVEKITSGDCVIDITADTTGPLDPNTGADEVVLSFNGKRGFTVRLDPNGRTGTVTKKTVCGSGVNTTDTQESKLNIAATTPVLPFPTTGTTLKGTAPTTVEVSSSGLFVGSRTSPWDVTATLNPDTKEELKLVIDDTEAYRKWRPRTTPEAGPGPRLGLVATVESTTGRDPLTAVETFTWELVGTSTEPGVTLNYPVGAADDRFDLDLDAEGELYELSNKNQRMLRVVRGGFKDVVQVVPHDWGGWSELKVTAQLADGRTLVGRMRGAAEDNVRLPKRAAGSFIADAWKDEQGVGGADSADDESAPKGDGTPGDGLSLYEEYRGFYEDQRHLEGKPKKKDFFVRNRAKGAALGGIARFMATSNLEVHHHLTDTELPASRVINANRRAGPQVTQQHAIIVEVVKGLTGYAQAEGGPANPKSITRVKVMEDWSQLPPGYLASTVAHELFHCVNVFHHGDKDYTGVWTVDAQGKLLDRGSVIRSVTEEGVDTTAAAVAYLTSAGGPTEQEMATGEEFGLHSGADTCVMRYDVAVVAVGKNDSSIRYATGEDHGTQLCRAPTGTGVNRPGRTPQPRYGDAAAGRGNCAAQILVTDKVDPPRR